MGVTKSTLRICKNGHKYYKRSDCPTCPICERANKPAEGFLSQLASPARNALTGVLGIDTVEQLATYSESEILALHGVGKASLPVLRKALEEKGLTYKDEA